MAETKTTERTLLRLYRNRGEQEPTKRLSQDVQFVILETIAGGHRVEADLLKLFPTDPGPCMGLASAAFGMNTVLGNEIAGKDKSDPVALAQMMRDRLEAIYEGEWSEGRQGPQVKHVLAAWAADAEQRRGKPTSPEAIETMRQKLLTGEVQSKDLLNQTGINAHYQHAKALRAIADADKAKAAATAAPTSDPSKYDLD